MTKVITWGDPMFGGDCSGVSKQLIHVQQIQAAGQAFAAITRDGSLVTWGEPSVVRKSCVVQEQLQHL